LESVIRKLKIKILKALLELSERKCEALGRRIQHPTYKMARWDPMGRRWLRALARKHALQHALGKLLKEEQQARGAEGSGSVLR
jgi:hypothetical protein